MFNPASVGAEGCGVGRVGAGAYVGAGALACAGVRGSRTGVSGCGCESSLGQLGRGRLVIELVESTQPATIAPSPANTKCRLESPPGVVTALPPAWVHNP